PPAPTHTLSLHDALPVLYSFRLALVTIAVSLLLLVPTAFWVRLKVPRLRPIVELITLMPFVIPPVILVFGLIRIYSAQPLPIIRDRKSTRLNSSHVKISY